jgi:oligopeptide transport system ATP-binding protein
MKVCQEHDPQHAVISGEHTAACWLLDPKAPKVDRPVKLGVL